MSDEAFDWLADPDVIVRDQRAVAVYPNENGGIVIRAERDWCDEQDTWMVVAPEHAVSLLYAIIRATGRPLQLVEIAEGGTWRDVGNPLPDRIFPPAGRSDNNQDGAETDQDGDRVASASTPRDRTAAERMRRYRLRKREQAQAERNQDENVTTGPNVTQGGAAA